MRWDWLSASLVGAGLLLICAPSHARVPTRLVYARTPSARDCPDEAGLAAAVAARLGYEPFSPWGDQTILATITRNGDVLLGRAELIDHDGIGQGSREVRLSNPECDELILALALAISITLDPLHVEAPVPSPAEAPAPPPAVPENGEHVAEPAAAPSPPVTLDRAPVPARERRTQPPPVTWHVAAAAMGALNVGPQFVMGGRLGVMAKRGRWALGIEGWSTLPSTQAAFQAGEVRVRLLSAALTPCLRLVGGFSLCALGSLGSMRAEGRGVEVPRVENVLHAAVGGRGLFVWPLGDSFELLANADLAATLHRPRFQLDEAEVWRPGPALALVGIGAAARFF